MTCDSGIPEAPAFEAQVRRHARELHVHCYGQPAVAGHVRTPCTTRTDRSRCEAGLVREIVTSDGRLLEHFDLPTAL